MPRYFLELAYKGTEYSGFQVQDNAHTIQAEIQLALQTLFRQFFELTGSSRTDAGVHANQNFFHFDSDIEIAQKHIYNLNALVSDAISIKGVYIVPNDAHCRFDALSREYKYLIYKQKDPFLQDRGWHYPYPLNLELLQNAASILQEYEDFTSFSKRNTQVNNFRCGIQYSNWGQLEEGQLIYKVKANRFLRGMVRGLVGTMLKVGREQLSLKEFRGVIEAKDCTYADFTTPPQGLFLDRINYKESLKPYLNGLS